MGFLPSAMKAGMRGTLAPFKATQGLVRGLGKGPMGPLKGFMGGMASPFKGGGGAAPMAQPADLGEDEGLAAPRSLSAPRGLRR